MTINFGDTKTSDIFHGRETKASRKFPSNILLMACRKLDMINAASQLKDLKIPPDNRLEHLKGDLAGFYSIRVNKQFRIIFQWKNGNADQVKLLDYH